MKTPCHSPSIAQLTRSMQQKNYREFSSAFKQLKLKATSNHEAKLQLIEVHNHLTGGATKRILNHASIAPEQLSMSEYLFRLYTARQ